MTKKFDKTIVEEFKESSKSRVALNISKEMVREVELSILDNNPYQPRLEIDESEVLELAESIKSQGLAQPIIVAENPDNTNRYIIVAGHRRYTAYKKLGFSSIPAIIREYSKKELSTIVIVENLQRKDLHPLELALSYNSLIENGIFTTHEEIALSLGKSISHISKILSLLKLPNEIISEAKKREYKKINVLSKLSNMKIEDNLKTKLFFEIFDLSEIEALNYIKQYENKQIDCFKCSKKNGIFNIRIDINNLENRETVIKELEQILNELRNS
ncbi:MAG: ParB/RepB/Spo0J family partition protein [Campylobacterales bacterium]|nr:ParB/RepB/Spo0J family partition protein [Campylobacterales bacterium]